MTKINCNFSNMVVDRYMKDIHGMQNIPDTGFEEASRGSFNFIGVLFHTGVIGDNDDLFVLDPKISQRLNDFDVCFEILYQLSKLRGRPYVSWQEVLIDSDYYQRGQLMILRRHFYSPEIWTGETNFCSPNDKLIQYAVQRVNEVREKRK